MQKFVPIKQLEVPYNGAASDVDGQNTEIINDDLIIPIKNAQESKNIERKTITENHSVKNKMCGYLKKKRNKVGGWRKIWCVLKDQLLLSFNSKEDWDKDLLSFKDVLNIVPGTIVKPLDRLNFTIETTTDCCYTFRCNDRESCTNWITALVESLPVKSNSKGLMKYNSSTELISSTELPKAKPSEISMRDFKPKSRMSVSCESIHNHNHQNYRTPKIPIATATAKILKRNGMEDMKRSFSNHKIQPSHSEEQKNLQENLDKAQRANNFRLHDKHVSSSGFVNQSNEVSRINRMFDDNTKKNLLQNKIHNKLKQSISSDSNIYNKQLVEDSVRKSKSFANNSDLIVKKINFNAIKVFDNINTKINTEEEKNNNIVQNVENDINVGFKNCKNKQRLSVKNHKLYSNKENKIESYFYGMNHLGSSSTDSDLIPSIEEQTQRLSIFDDLQQSDEYLNGASNFRLLSQKTLSISKHDNRRDPMVAVNDVDISLSDLQKFYPLQHIEGSSENYGAEYSEIVFPSATQKQSSNSIALNNDLILNSLSNDDIKSENEPIYAVVDLKNKYEQRRHRKKKLNLELKNQIKNAIDTVDGSHVDDEIGGKPRPKSAIFISTGDYEEVLNFSTESLRNCDVTPDASSESENIYEPINIPYDPQYCENAHRANGLWKYFSIDALIDMARTRKSRNKLSKLEHSISSPLSTSLTNTQQHQSSNSPFSVLRRKLGNHRKSIKLRMKNFYKRNNNCPDPVIIIERNAFSDDELDSQGASGSTGSATSESLKSIAGSSAEKQFTPISKNFPHLSKSRPSLYVDEHEISHNKTSLFSSELNDFHRENRESSEKTSKRKAKGYTP